MLSLQDVLFLKSFSLRDGFLNEQKNVGRINSERDISMN